MRITLDNIEDTFKAKPCDVETMELMGYKLIDTLFADSSGMGQDDEASLTQDQLTKRVTELVLEHGPLYAKLVSIGMFQVYVGLFKRGAGEKKAKRLSTNVLLIDKGEGKRVVRLYETDILTDNGDGTLTVDNGGYATRTTHKWINDLSTLHAQSKQYETYINGTNLNEQQVFAGRLTV